MSVPLLYDAEHVAIERIALAIQDRIPFQYHSASDAYCERDVALEFRLPLGAAVAMVET